MKRISVYCLIYLAVAGNAFAADFSSDAVGTAGSDFLTLDVGARGIGMGGAFSAVVDDASSMYWNPAGLARISDISATLMHNSLINGISYDYAAYAQRIPKSFALGGGSVVGGAIRYFDAGSIPGTDINGNSIGSFHPRSYVYELGVGQNISDLFDTQQNITMGITGRFFSSTIDKTASGFAADVGGQYRYDKGRFPRSFSFVVQNIGQGEKYDTTRSNLPLRMRLGGAVNATESLLLSSDLILPISNQPDLSGGAEYTLAAMSDVKFALRAGLDSQMLLNSLDGFRGLNLGFGVSAMNINFDYAFAPMGILGNTHRISLTVNWGSSETSERYRER